MHLISNNLFLTHQPLLIKLLKYMHPGSFHYEEKDQNFPQIGAPRRNDNTQIGKILSRYQFRNHNDAPQNNRTKNNSVHAGTALNYSQIYNDLKINKNQSGKSTPLNQEEQSVSKEIYHNQQIHSGNSPYHFQSAAAIGSRMNKKKALPGLIAKTPRESQRNYQQPHSSSSQYRSQFGVGPASVQNNNNISFDGMEESEKKPSTMMDRGRKFRINEVKDQNNKKINYQQVSDLYISDNQDQIEENNYQRTPKNTKVTQSEAVIMNKQQKTHKQIGKLTDKSRFNHISKQVNEQYLPDSRKKDEKEQQKTPQKQIQLQKHINWDKQLQKSMNNSSKVKQQKDDQEDPTTKTNIQKQKQVAMEKRSNIAEEKQLGHSRSIGVGNHKINQQDLLNSFHEQSMIGFDRQSINMKKKKVNNNDSNNKQQTQQSAHFNYQSQQKQQKSKQEIQKIIVHFPQVDEVEQHPPAKDMEGMKNSNMEGINNGSRIASTIHQNQDELGDHLLNQIEKEEFESGTKQPEEEVPQKIPQPEQYVSTFSIEQYMQLYPVLKSIQTALKASLINVQEILRGIKKYLEIIAAGNLDNIDQFNLALHKKKIIKNSLFFERVSIIIIAFAYVSFTIKDSHKFLLNIIAYSINNSLILIKVLEQTQIGQGIKKSTIILHKKQQTLDNMTSVQQKSDRLAMKRNLDTLRNNNDVILDAIHKLSKSDEVFYENLKQIVKVINKSSLQQTFYNLLEYFSFYLNVSELQHMIPFLAVAPNPYLSPTVGNTSRSSLKYTLVIDILQIFCLGTKKAKSNVFRPYSQHFLHEMSQYYDIVAFTTAFPNNIDKVIDMLDPKGYIQHRLYKHHAVNKNKVSLKEVDRIGRDMDQIILLDNQNGGGQGSYDNCIHIPVWKGSKNDTILAQLCPLLAMIALKRIRAPEAVSKVREQSFKNKQNGVKYINFGITLD